MRRNLRRDEPRVRAYFPAVRWLVAAQMSMIGLVALGASWFGDGLDVRSALLGGLAAFLPNLYFASRVGFFDPAKSAKDVIKSFYLGETIKLILTAASFFILFQLPDIRFLPLFIAFGAVLTVFWLALLIRSNDISMN